MNIEITPFTLDEFKLITGNDVRGSFVDYSIFYQTDYLSIKNFYNGKSKNITPDAFVNFSKVKNKIKESLSSFQNFNNNLENIKFVELLEQIESCYSTLMSLNKINKWSRATTDSFGYNPYFKLQYVLSQYDTLEKIANLVVKSNNPQNDWRGIAIDNMLAEDDYTFNGGKVLSVTMENQGFSNFNISSVADVIRGKSVLGRDLDRNMHFDVNEQDLCVLSEDDTVEQAINILVTLRKRDNLDFLDHGLQASLIVGETKSLFNFPIVARQLIETIRRDDTLKNFSLTNFRFEEDIVYIDFAIETRLNEVIELTAQL